MRRIKENVDSGNVKSRFHCISLYRMYIFLLDYQYYYVH
jgi:hypothetical protein